MSSVSITIKTTDACNMRCKHCYHASVGYISRFLDLEDAKKILFLAAHEYGLINVLFMGGEPTLWGLYRFKEIIEYQNHLKNTLNVNFINTIQTNGLLLDLDWINFFKEYNFRVGISFDGPHNNDLREKTEIVLSNIRLVKENNLNFNILCVENKKSINNLKHTYEWFKENNLNFKILPLFMSGEALKHEDLELDSDEYVDIFVDTYKNWIRDENCNIKISTFQELLKISHKCVCDHRGSTCIYNRIAIVAGGDIYPCGRPYTDDFRIGHISDFKSIKDMFCSKGYHYIADMYKSRLENCSNCEVFDSCRGGCISDAILENYFDKVDNPYCIRTKKMLKAIHTVNQEIYSDFDKNTLKNVNQVAKVIIKNSIQQYRNANLSVVNSKM